MVEITAVRPGTDQVLDKVQAPVRPAFKEFVRPSDEKREYHVRPYDDGSGKTSVVGEI